MRSLTHIGERNCELAGDWQRLDCFVGDAFPLERRITILNEVLAGANHLGVRNENDRVEPARIERVGWMLGDAELLIGGGESHSWTFGDEVRDGRHVEDDLGSR